MNKQYNKILVLGAGPVKIGQSLEFDYSALQVCRAFKEEGITVIFVNSTPSALATDKTFADKVYIEPLNIESVKKILEKERPDALLATAGGDDGLELGLELAQNGYLDETQTELLCVDREVIRSVKNRHSFTEALEDMDEPSVDALVVNSAEEACDFADKAGYPVIVRPAFTPDRESAEYCYTRDALFEKAEISIENSVVSQILIEKSIAGWKELEFEVIRDINGNCITVESAENVDPVGIHTGDSVVVIPAQTLSACELEMLRNAAVKIASKFEIKGSCNVQFALSPDGKEYVVTGVDPRLNRTSSLISKATGYDIAYVSAKVALGKAIDEIGAYSNDGNAKNCAVKFPKWSFENFDDASRKLGTMMQATGECIAVGENFVTAFMKAVRSVSENHIPHLPNVTDDELKKIIELSDDRRIFAVYEALYRDFNIDELHNATNIDKQFLNKIKNITEAEKRVNADKNLEAYENAKKMGFTDFAIEQIVGEKPEYSLNASYNYNKTYLYSVYGENDSVKSTVSNKKKVLVVGSGPVVAGKGGDSDYCTVHAINTLKEMGMEVVVIDNNPASVTTDYNISDRLYLEPLRTEDILGVVKNEKPDYALLLFGGDDAIKKSDALKNAGVEIIGPDFEFYKKIMNKIEFFDILDYANVKHTSSKKVYVGTCIEAHVISDGEDYFVPAICEHIEKAHINSGDSISVSPMISVDDTMKKMLAEYIKGIASELSFKGMLDLQFVVFDNDLFVTKATVSDTTLIPYMAKASGVDIVSLAVRCMAGEKLSDMGIQSGIAFDNEKYFVRVPVFSFEKLHGADMLLGEKTKSTGDVMGVGDTFDNALLKAMMASGTQIKRTGSVLVSVRESDKSDTLKLSEEFLSQNFKVYATSDTARILNSNHIATNSASASNAVELINANKFSYVVSTLESSKANDDNLMIRRAALMKHVPVFTSVQSAYAFAKSLANNNVMEELEVTDI